MQKINFQLNLEGTLTNEFYDFDEEELTIEELCEEVVFVQLQDVNVLINKKPLDLGQEDTLINEGDHISISRKDS